MPANCLGVDGNVCYGLNATCNSFTLVVSTFLQPVYSKGEGNEIVNAVKKIGSY